MTFQVRSNMRHTCPNLEVGHMRYLCTALQEPLSALVVLEQVPSIDGISTAESTSTRVPSIQAK